MMAATGIPYVATAGLEKKHHRVFYGPQEKIDIYRDAAARAWTFLQRTPCGWQSGRKIPIRRILDKQN